VFPETGPREHHKTVCFRELALFYPCDEPYRKSAGKLNRALRRKEGQEVRARTMANLVEREGEHILEDHGFTTNGSIIDQQKVRSAIDRQDNEVVSHMIEEFNRGQEKAHYLFRAV
jgi:hypothetical protein